MTIALATLSDFFGDLLSVGVGGWVAIVMLCVVTGVRFIVQRPNRANRIRWIEKSNGGILLFSSIHPRFSIYPLFFFLLLFLLHFQDNKNIKEFEYPGMNYRSFFICIKRVCNSSLWVAMLQGRGICPCDFLQWFVLNTRSHKINNSFLVLRHQSKINMHCRWQNTKNIVKTKNVENISSDTRNRLF